MATAVNQRATSSRVDPKLAEKAINALLKWRSKEAKNQKPQIIEKDEYFYLILTLKKIPQSRPNPDKIPLPHPLIRPESELCLIVDDRAYKSRVTKEAAEKKIQGEGIMVTKVLKLSKLKSEFKSYEDRMELCNSYEMFLVDKGVVQLLPKLLGKNFFTKKKIPVPVDLSDKNWKEQVEKVCSSGLLYLRTGTCCVVKVAKVSMTKDEIKENVMAAIEGIGEIVPKKWKNIRSLHLKLLESIALPVYEAVPDLALKIESGKEKEVERLNRVEKTEMKGKKTKGRIDEVGYLNVGEVLDGDELGESSDEDEVDGGENMENEKINSGEIGGKKRKKGDVTESLKEAKEKKKDGAKHKKLKKKVY
ncbi:hypothetical protein ACFE04_031260 [Oxalis oulophora]